MARFFPSFAVFFLVIATLVPAHAATRKPAAKTPARTVATKSAKSSAKPAKTTSKGGTKSAPKAGTTAKAGAKKSSTRSKTAPAKKLRGQQSIESARVLEIQQALIREHYLSGEPSGSWDVASQEAMRKFQGDQGWQTKLVPDSRALKKLGLGPDYSAAINAQGSNFVPPPPPSTIPSDQSAGFTDASGVNH